MTQYCANPTVVEHGECEPMGPGWFILFRDEVDPEVPQGSGQFGDASQSLSAYGQGPASGFGGLEVTIEGDAEEHEALLLILGICDD